MTEEEKQIWTSTIKNVLRENEEWDDKNASERYHVTYKDIKMPPKVVLSRAFDQIEEKYPELELKSVGGGVPTNQFLEDFGFIITEDLLFNNTDSKKLKKHIDKKFNNRSLFQDFINFGSQILNDLEIGVYKVRMALESQGNLSVIVGMRAAYSYNEKDRVSQVGFLVSTSFKEKHSDNYDFVYEYPYKGNPDQCFIKIVVDDWNEIDSKLLQEHKIQFKLQYDEIKNSKRTQWNVEAKTTNYAYKYILFKNENIEKFMAKETTNDSMSNLKPYFNFDMLAAYGQKVDKTYNSKSEEAKWFYDTRNKLYYLVDLLSERLGVKLEVVYKEKPNGQRGPSLIGFKDYILAGFAPEGFNVGDDLFIKVAISKLKTQPVFDINIDLNFRKKSSPFQKKRDEIFNTHYKEWTIDETFPDNWADLLDLIGDEIKYVMNMYKLYLNTSKPKSSKANIEISLNQILYGPPGTGKTYETISTAISIVDPDFFKANENDREALVAKFKELTISNWTETSGQIAFCTFHQSFTYEDFVEGIKPKVVDDKDIIYEVQKGVFKALCDRARTATNDTSDFDTVISKLQNHILENGVVTLQTNRGNKFDVNYTGQTTFRIKPHESTQENPQYPAAIDNIRMLYEGAPLTDVYNPSYVKGILEHLFEEYGLSKFEEVKDNDKPYVIIIDEINRGNVAAIFGELITLIEVDKRAGGKEELSVILPYSKKEFKVPNNVHIIGTMNTADRSVEALDSALRRRFSFKEIMPKYDVIQNHLKEKNNWNNLEIHSILEKINKRITRLVDRDHQIGHSYFLKFTDRSNQGITQKLKSIFSENIIPLLQEYFFNDINKIGLVLGRYFLKAVEKDKNIFADFPEGDSGNYEDDIFEIIDPIDMKNDQFLAAIQKLVN